MIFYKFFLKNKNWGGLTVDEQIVLSALINYGIMNQGEFWNGYENEFMMDEMYEALEDSKGIYGNVSVLEFMPITYKYIARYCGLPESSLKGQRGIIQRLRDKRVMITNEDGYWVVTAPIKIIKKGWFKLVEGTRLKGRQLLFYSFLTERLNHYNENQHVKRGKNIRCMNNREIDTWAYRLAMDFGETKTAVYSLIRELTKKGYVKRLPSGKLEIVSPEYAVPVTTNANDSFEEVEDDLPF